MKRITIKDLAKLLNLSTSTVSRALSDHPDISTETKMRVRKLAEEFNYTTNLHARLFRKQNSRLIALILPEINMFFSPKLIEGINSVITSSKYSLITFLSNDSYEREKEIVEQCLAWAVEGVMVSLSSETLSIDHLLPFSRSDVKCVLLDRTLEQEVFSTVQMDGIEASGKAVSHLIQEGHRNILGLFGTTKLKITQDRIQGYIKAMQEHNIPLLEENIITVERSSELDSILPAVLNHNKHISAIFTMSDELLAKCYFHINALGMSIPQDISIVSISDGIFPQLIYPKITHVRDSGSKLGRKTCNFLIDLLSESKSTGSKQLKVPTKLIELDSVQRLS